jgi:hypothetical protein
MTRITVMVTGVTAVVETVTMTAVAVMVTATVAVTVLWVTLGDTVNRDHFDSTSPSFLSR